MVEVSDSMFSVRNVTFRKEKQNNLGTKLSVWTQCFLPLLLMEAYQWGLSGPMLISSYLQFIFVFESKILLIKFSLDCKCHFKIILLKKYIFKPRSIYITNMFLKCSGRSLKYHIVIEWYTLKPSAQGPGTLLFAVLYLNFSESTRGSLRTGNFIIFTA